MTLLLAIDDATGTAPYAIFQEQETTVGYLRLMLGIVQQRGIPLALYTDRPLRSCSHPSLCVEDCRMRRLVRGGSRPSLDEHCGSWA